MGNENVLETLITAKELDINDETVERAILYGRARSLEEVLYFVYPNSEGFFEHKFMPEEELK